MEEWTLDKINFLLTDAVYRDLATVPKDSPYKQLRSYLQQYMIVYQIENIQNHKIYIGSSGERSPLKRLKRHASELHAGTHCNPHLQRAYNKYGKENFRYTILELLPKTDNDEFNLKYRESVEQKYIDELQSADFNKGYNIAEHVHGGFNDCTWETLEQRTSIKPEKLREYFDLLANTDLTFPEIDKAVGIHKKLAYKLYFGYSFRRLASEYTFRPRVSRDAARGENSSSSKLTNEQALEIINILLHDTAITYKAIGDKFGVSRATVRDIYKKRNWKHLTKDIEFPLRDFETKN